MPNKKNPHPIDKHVGMRLRAARMEAGISQENSGKALGLTFQQLQKYEKASNRVSASKLALLAKLYKKPIGWFFDGAPGLDDLRQATESAPDVSAQMLALPYGADLAQLYVAIEHNVDRHVVVSVARALAPHSRPRLRAVG